jgi:hypothetical protein
LSALFAAANAEATHFIANADTFHFIASALATLPRLSSRLFLSVIAYDCLRSKTSFCSVNGSCTLVGHTLQMASLPPLSPPQLQLPLLLALACSFRSQRSEVCQLPTIKFQTLISYDPPSV